MGIGPVGPPLPKRRNRKEGGDLCAFEAVRPRAVPASAAGPRATTVHIGAMSAMRIREPPS